MSIFLANEYATMTLGQILAKYLEAGMNIYLHGNLGAGKTTLVRGLIQYFIADAKVKSPTYTLVEDYDVATSTYNDNKLQHIYHFDLYRIVDPEELEYLGGRDYFDSDAVCLVEWPERGEAWLKPADIEISLDYQADGRNLILVPRSEKGKRISEKIIKLWENGETRGE